MAEKDSDEGEEISISDLDSLGIDDHIYQLIDDALGYDITSVTKNKTIITVLYDVYQISEDVLFDTDSGGFPSYINTFQIELVYAWDSPKKCSELSSDHEITESVNTTDSLEYDDQDFPVGYIDTVISNVGEEEIASALIKTYGGVPEDFPKILHKPFKRVIDECFPSGETDPLDCEATEVPIDSFEALAQYEGGINLNEITGITKKAAQFLSQHTGDIWLEGLIKPSSSILKILRSGSAKVHLHKDCK